MTPFKTYWMPQNTGWTNGVSWFDTGSVRFASKEEAEERNRKQKEWLKDPSVQFRVKYVETREIYYYE